VTKARVCKVASKREAGSHTTYFWSVRRCEGMNPHTPREFDFGSWSPGELPNFHRAIARVKTQWLEKKFISLKSSWNVNI
jgi:hypothetical protein